MKRIEPPRGLQVAGCQLLVETFVPIRGPIWLALLLLMSACCSCDSGHAQKSVAAAPAPTVWGTATIRGKVSFAGVPPIMRMLPNQPCCEDSKPILEESVVVGPTGGLANTFVFLVDAAASAGPLPPAKLDQENCRFIPHVVGVDVGQTLVLSSQDPTMHNVNYVPVNNPPGEFSMSFPGSEETTSFIAPEFIHAKCGVHPWMSAWIGVFANPFFAVSGPDGSFEISRVPAGHYKIAAWHEQYGQQQEEVIVENGQAVEANFEFKSP